MQRITALLGTLAIALAVGGTANAGYWEVTYDMSTSTNTTNSPAGALTDPLSGKWRFQFDSASKAAAPPYSGARLIAGTQHLELSQIATNADLTLTGTSDSTMLPVAGGQPTVIAGATLNPFIVPEYKTTGYNHCYGPLCILAGFTVGASVPIPLTDNVTFPVPRIVFTGANAGDGSNFTADPKTDIVGANGTNVVTIYRGVEVSRYYITGDVPALGGGALLSLAAVLLVGGTSTLALRNRRR